MPSDVVDLRDFYRSPLGQVARRMIRGAIRRVWPDLRGMRLLGVGYPTPFLSALSAETERMIALMPASLGVLAWAPEGRNLAVLADEGELPFADYSIDRVLLVHMLETSDEVGPMLKEIWRVLAGGGRLLIVAPNRRGIWARLDRTPFGSGRPYSLRQLSQLLREELFTPIGSDTALFVPPTASRMVLRSARAWERIGRRFFPAFAGVVLVEAGKQIYAKPAEKRAPRRRLALSNPPLVLAGRVEARPLADQRGMGDKSALFAPPMKLVARRLEGEGERRRGGEIEGDLMGRARRGAGEAPVDRAVKMAAQDPLDLRVARDDLGEGGDAAQTDAVHMTDPGHKGRMVHQQQARAPRRRRQRPLEPVQALPAQRAAGRAGDQGVERDNAQRPLLDRIVQKALARQIAVGGKGLAQRLAGVVVAGDDEDRHPERRQQRAQMGIFLGRPGVDEIAGHDGQVRSRIKAGERRHRALQAQGGIDGAVGEFPGTPDMGIGDLGDEHHAPSPPLPDRPPDNTKMPCAASRLARPPRGSSE